MKYKFLCKTNCFFILILLLFSTVFSKTEQDVIDDIAKLTASDQLFNLYTHETNDYFRAYIIREIPAFLERIKAPNTPKWIVAAIYEGLQSNDAYLIEESINLAGVLGIDKFSKYIVGHYTDAPVRFTPDISRIRLASVNALAKIDKGYRKENIHQLLRAKSQDISSPEFQVLMTEVQKQGDGSFEPELDSIQVNIERSLASIVPGSPREQYRKQYEEALIKLKNTKKTIKPEGAGK